MGSLKKSPKLGTCQSFLLCSLLSLTEIIFISHRSIQDVSNWLLTHQFGIFTFQCNAKAHLNSSSKDEHFPLIYTLKPHEAFSPFPGLTVPTQFSQGLWGGGHPSPCHFQLTRQDHSQFIPQWRAQYKFGVLYIVPCLSACL